MVITTAKYYLHRCHLVRSSRVKNILTKTVELAMKTAIRAKIAILGSLAQMITDNDPKVHITYVGKEYCWRKEMRAMRREVASMLAHNKKLEIYMAMAAPRIP